MLSTTAFVLVIVILITQIVKLFRWEGRTYEVEQIFFLLAALFLLADFGYRSYQIRFPAVTNTYEALIFFSAVICILLYIQAKKIVPPDGGATVSPSDSGGRLILFIGTLVVFIFVSLASSPLIPASLQPPVPALQSYWLVAHVLLSFVGESFFVVSFAASIVYLAGSKSETRTRADQISYTSILIGYFLFTIGAMLFGMIWAEKAWGSYWSWDPKETWALVTWLNYTLYLHIRLVWRKTGKLPAVIAIIGFLLTMFTFFGVNYLMSGLHSYV